MGKDVFVEIIKSDKVEKVKIVEVVKDVKEVKDVKDGFIQMAVDAPKGMECTKAYFKVENVSLGYDYS